MRRPKTRSQQKVTSIERLFHDATNTDDDPIIRCGPYSKRTHKGLFRFIVDMFALNEICSRDKKKTNKALAEFLVAEFPGKVMLKETHEGTKHGINYYRQLYNTARLLDGEKPQWISFRYNLRGNRVDNRSGRKEMNTSQQKAYMDHYRGKLAARFSKQQAEAVK